MKKEIKILAESSGRHVHLCQADLQALFGPEAELEPKRLLGDGGGGFISQYKVTVEGKDGKSCQCSVLGPLRKESQVEFSFTEARAIGLVPPLGDSGVLEGTSPVRLTGTAGSVDLPRGPPARPRVRKGCKRAGHPGRRRHCHPGGRSQGPGV